jgi:TetR/AcrR family tetracycline transcriptional repressor
VRGQLSREQLVEEALLALARDGLAGLSTRRLAERLNVKSPALYWHVRNKDELLQMVADAICSRMQLPDPGLPYRERLSGIAHEYRRVLVSHRDAARLFAEQPPTGPHRMKLYDAAIGAFRDAGFALSEAVAMATFYRHYLLGMITEEVRGRWSGGMAGPFPPFALGMELKNMHRAPADCPHLAEASGYLAGIRPEELFVTGLEVLLDGIQQRVARLAPG